MEYQVTQHGDEADRIPCARSGRAADEIEAGVIAGKYLAGRRAECFRTNDGKVLWVEKRGSYYGRLIVSIEPVD
jgi:hypothetical protein